MITLKQIFDVDLLKESLVKDDLYKLIGLTESLENIILDIICTSWYVICDENREIGIFIIRPFTNDCLSFHGGLYKEYRHKNTPAILIDCLNKIPSTYKTSFMTTVHLDNIPTIRLLQKMKFNHKTTIDMTAIFTEE